MQTCSQYWKAFAEHKAAFWIVLLVAFILHVGTTITGGLYADDYIHQSYFLGSSALQKLGFLDGIAVGNLADLLKNQFNFFDPSQPNYAAMKNFGILPWWASDGALLHFFRPLATLTHYIDYQYWPHNTHIMHALSLVWYVLSIVIIYAVYRSFTIQKSVALLALLLVVLDHSVFQVVTWIASRSMLMVMFFGFFTLYAYHKSIGSLGWYIIALLALLCAALSAEAVVSICAYLGAYMLVMDNRAWLKRFMHLLPFALLIIVWHRYYVLQGYGAFGVDFYIDPGHEPKAFLQEAIWRLPANFFELMTGVDVLAGQVRADLHRYVFAIAGVLSCAVITSLLWQSLKQDKALRFFYCASCLSLVPGLTIALSPRVMLIPFVGMAIVLASIVVNNAEPLQNIAYRIARKCIISYVFIIHIILSLALAGSVLVSSLTAVPPTKPYGYVDLGVGDITNKTVVVINASRPFWLAFFPHYRLAVNESLPASLRVLGSAFYPLKVTRINEYQLLIEGLPAIQLDAETIVQQPEQAHIAYLMQSLMGLIRSSRDKWQVGSVYTYADMSITVESLFRGKPQRLLITLLQHDLQQYRWSYWDNDLGQYRAFVLPNIGSSVTIKGIFSASQDDEY